MYGELVKISLKENNEIISQNIQEIYFATEKNTAKGGGGGKPKRGEIKLKY